MAQTFLMVPGLWLAQAIQSLGKKLAAQGQGQGLGVRAGGAAGLASRGECCRRRKHGQAQRAWAVDSVEGCGTGFGEAGILTRIERSKCEIRNEIILIIRPGPSSKCEIRNRNP